METCPHCQRPWKKLTKRQRARAGDWPGEERSAAEAADEEELSNACAMVLAALKRAQHAGTDWVSAAELRALGFDGPRRARQLRDEWGWPIQVEMRTKPKQAWYRIAPTSN